MKLYEMTDEAREIMEAIAEAEGVIEPEQEARLAAIGEAFEAKAETIAKFIKTIEAESLVFRSEETRCATRRRALDNKAEWLKGYLLAEMQKAGAEKVKGATLAVSVRAGNPSCNVFDEDAVPDTFKREKTEVTIDKKAVLDAMKDGQEVPGAEMERKPYLAIR